MTRVSAERMFRSHFPDARIEMQKRNGVTGLSIGRYYLVRSGTGRHEGTGETKAQAWASACRTHGIKSLKPVVVTADPPPSSSVRALVDDLLQRIEDATNHLSLGECRAVMAELVDDIGLKLAAVDDGEVE